MEESYRLATSLTADQVRGNFADPESVSFWELPEYITASENSGLSTAGYRLQYQKLIAPFLFAAMVLLASAVSLRFFRLGGVQKMVLSGIAAGFLLYVLSKVTEDLSKAELMHPIAAAWLPVACWQLRRFAGLAASGGRVVAVVATRRWLSALPWRRTLVRCASVCRVRTVVLRLPC